MAKLQIFESSKGSSVPFLRGILTRSLQDVGLSFDDAFELASVVRRELEEDGDKDDITTTHDIRDRVIKHLRRDYQSSIADLYGHPHGKPPELRVVCADGHTSAFSRSRLGRCLQSAGLSPETTSAVPGTIFQHYLDRGRKEVSSEHLRELAARILRRGEGGAAAERRYRMWLEFSNGSRPLLLLIGGASGCGKSTVASELAARLDIVRTQSTDMLREVMRMMVPERLIPVLHASSFEAWRALPTQGGSEQDFDTVVADGFRAQSEHVSVACEAVIHRAVRERVSLILEGVHVQKSLLDLVPRDADVSVVLVMLGVLDPNDLKARFKGRGSLNKSRGAPRYLEHFDAIWSLQSSLLAEADAAGIAVVRNVDRQAAVQQIMRIILTAVARKRTRVSKVSD